MDQHLKFPNLDLCITPKGSAYLITDIPEIMEMHQYPSESRWCMTTLNQCLLSHAEAGVNISSPVYQAGYNNSVDQLIVSAQEIIKHQSQILLENVELPELEPSDSFELMVAWVKQAIETLVNQHVKAGFDYQDRSYQEATYSAYCLLEDHANSLTQSSEKEFGAGPSADF